jgi:TusA-related sulfurtransferase
MSGSNEVSQRLDLRGLDPPEPMRRALEAIEALTPDSALEVVTDREPMLLHREFARRHHAYVSEVRADGCHTVVRRSGGPSCQS